MSLSTKNTSPAYIRDVYIYEIPPSLRRKLCDHLDELNVWTQLAEAMGLKPVEQQSIRRQQQIGNSPTDELLKIWGGQYNHTCTELFVLFRRQNLHEAMQLVKDHVERKYHLLIPKSQPHLSKLLPQQSSRSEKLLNKSPDALNNNDDSNRTDHNLRTTDNNVTPSSYNTTDNQTTHSEGNSISLNERNVKEYASSLLEINYFELSEATNNWSDRFILGKGGFGTVFRGYWKHTDVAIKQLHYRGPNERDSVKIQIQQSLNELKYLNSCRHDNVLPLYGYSIKGEKPCLVYQLMKGGSLEQRLNSSRFPPLTWHQRITISLGTARGINYLHTFRDKPLIHGDIKPANILLDQCLQPKIGDFGLAREGPNAVNSAVEVTQVFGTKPYLPPEFLNSKQLSTQVDTYSFGVVLLEICTGLRVYDKKRAHPLLARHVLKLCASGETKLDDFIDKNVPLLPGELELCQRTIQLGIECITDNPQYRPEMEHVLKVIDSYYSSSRMILQNQYMRPRPY